MEISFVFFAFLILNTLPHVKAQPGFISIDCGVDGDYKDDTTGIFYNSDAKFIDSGENTKLSYSAPYNYFDRQLRTVRSFPVGDKNCYTLSPEQGKNNEYLIRALFMYGNYDSKNQIPVFKLYLGVEEWDTIQFNGTYSAVLREIIHVPKTDDIYVCLVNTGSGTPFISALELRHLDNSMYNKTQSGSLVLSSRLYFGSTTNETIRYQDDEFDRIWSPFHWSTWTPIKAPFGSSSLSESDYKVPSKVMETATVPASGTTLDFTLGVVNPSQEFYLYFHFAELQEVGNQIRQFTISLNNKIIFNPIQPRYLYTDTYPTPASVSGSQLSFSLAQTNQSTLPPIMNALEVYMLKEFSQSPTAQSDVDAVKKIKSVYNLVKISWQGDPCLPINYSWDGLICSDNGYDASTILSLNLSSSNLTGKIDTSFSKLMSLQYLDLSYNSLSEDVPEFLSEMASLKTLNLSWNKLTGSVPSALLARQNDGTLNLSLDGNPGLCKTNKCPNGDKNSVAVPVGASLAAIFVVGAGAFAIYWVFIRGKTHGKDAGAKPNGDGRPEVLNNPPPKKEPIEDENSETESVTMPNEPIELRTPHFSYSEVEIITRKFAEQIGEGGSALVYSGHLRNGMKVAVKRLNTSFQSLGQFQNEAQLLTTIHHKNLVTLLGYCDEGPRKLLIYKYMANGNLKEHLEGKKGTILSWQQRLRIATNVAEALEYLHNGCSPNIVHRDVKTANILLNEKMEAKVSDFGWSRSMPSETGAHVSTTFVVGTSGYLDPLYGSTGQLTRESDVYSFGIVLLEIISGRPPKMDGAPHILSWVDPILKSGKIDDIVDPTLRGNFHTNSAWRAVETAMSCVPFVSSERQTMSHVLGELKECLKLTTAPSSVQITVPHHIGPATGPRPR